MEQKKILWIVLAVSVFVLIIFGAAILLYSPSSDGGASLQQAAAVLPPANNSRQNSTVDPESWLRDPETKPGLDTSTAPASTGLNLTIVNRNEAHTNYGELDVTGLTRPSSGTVQTDTSLSPDTIPGQPVQGSDTPAKQPAAEKPVQTTRTSSAETKPAERKEPVRKTAPAPRTTVRSKPKTVIVTDYWIQAGSYSSKLNAERARKTLADRYLNTEIFTRGTGDDTKYRVRVGPYKSKAEADYWLGTVKNLSDFADSYVSEVKTRK